MLSLHPPDRPPEKREQKSKVPQNSVVPQLFSSNEGPGTPNFSPVL